MRTIDELADISEAAWAHMTVAERAAVLVEHYVLGATFDPLGCGFCRDSRSVLDALAARPVAEPPV